MSGTFSAQWLWQKELWYYGLPGESVGRQMSEHCFSQKFPRRNCLKLLQLTFCHMLMLNLRQLKLSHIISIGWSYRWFTTLFHSVQEIMVATVTWFSSWPASLKFRPTGLALNWTTGRRGVEKGGFYPPYYVDWLSFKHTRLLRQEFVSSQNMGKCEISIIILH